jgi:hypothetical protein
MLQFEEVPRFLAVASLQTDKTSGLRTRRAKSGLRGARLESFAGNTQI